MLQAFSGNLWLAELGERIHGSNASHIIPRSIQFEIPSVRPLGLGASGRFVFEIIRDASKQSGSVPSEVVETSKVEHKSPEERENSPGLLHCSGVKYLMYLSITGHPSNQDNLHFHLLHQQEPYINLYTDLPEPHSGAEVGGAQ